MMQHIVPCTVAALARAKGLDAGLLRDEFGVRDKRWAGSPAVAIPYFDALGVPQYEVIRLSDGTARRSPAGSATIPYGLDRLALAPRGSTVLLVEGETDCWAAEAHAMLAVGVPGARAWRPEWAPLFNDVRPVVWQEPDDAGSALVVSIARSLPSAHVVAVPGVKDICELHQSGVDVREALESSIASAVSIRTCVAVTGAGYHSPSAPEQRLGRRRATRTLAFASTAFDDRVRRAREQPLLTVLERMGFTPIGRGINRAMRCPFHADTSPSLSLNVQSGFWKCHGCLASGDTITFVMRVRGIPFRDAVWELAP